MKVKFKTRLKVLLYGVYILEAFMLDNLLSDFKLNGMKKYDFERIPTESDKLFMQQLDFLVQENYLKSYNDGFFDITQKGALYLASGGFVAEVKRSKNALYAFRISLIAIVLALFSFLLSLANRLS